MVSTAVAPSAVARVVGIKTEFVRLQQGITFLPQRVAVIGQGNTATTFSTTKQQVTSAAQAGSLYGFGSPVYQAVRQLLPPNGDGVGSIPVTVYPLEDDGSGVAATGDITPGGTPTETQTYRARINNILSEQITLSSSDSLSNVVTKLADAINAVVEMPVTATADTSAGSESVDLEAKWAGETGNDIYIEMIGGDDVTWTITQMNGGTANPDIQPALDQFGDVWETMVLNCMNYDDTTTLDKLSTFGEGRWGALTRKPLVAFVGNTSTSVSSATGTTSGRRTDRTNCQLVAPGSNDLPVAVAARQLARIVKIANSDPPRDYGSLPADGLTPGADGDQWDYSQRDQAVKTGCSTVRVQDGEIKIADVVTMYRPEGEIPPAYRWVVDIVKLQNIIFNLDLRFATPEWDGAPLIPDDQPTVNRSAKKPKMAKAEAASIIDSLGLNAIISAPEAAKENTVAEIDSQNPKRLNLSLTVQLSGNTNILSTDLNFGFFFGTPEVVA